MNTRKKLITVIAAVLLVTALFGPLATASAKAPAHARLFQSPRLTLSQTVQTTFTRTYNWTIKSSARPSVLNMVDGDEAVSRFTVRVARAGYTDSAWTVSGTLHVQNDTASQAVITAVSGTILPSGAQADISCPASFPASLDPGASLDCTYTSALRRASTGRVRLVVETSGDVAGGVSTASFAFGKPAQVVNPTVQVEAGGQSFGPFSRASSFSFDKTFTCQSQPDELAQTASIPATGQSSQAQVSLNCSGFEYYKGIQTYQDSAGGWHLKGKLDIYNRGSARMWVQDITQLIGSDLTATVTCGRALPAAIAPGGTLSCAFDQALPDASDRSEFARVTVQSSHFALNGARTPLDTHVYLTDPTPLGFQAQ